MIDLGAVTAHAMALYYNHMGLCPHAYDFMWGQCSPEYRASWMYIAGADLEEFDESEEEFEAPQENLSELVQVQLRPLKEWSDK